MNLTQVRLEIINNSSIKKTSIIDNIDLTNGKGSNDILKPFTKVGLYTAHIAHDNERLVVLLRQSPYSNGRGMSQLK